MNYLSKKQEGGQQIEPELQQLASMINSSMEEGMQPIEVVIKLRKDKVDAATITQALTLMEMPMEEIVPLLQRAEDYIEQEEPTGEEVTQNPEQLARMQSMQEEEGDIDLAEETLLAKSGIEIKPENKGKFTKWAKQRGMTVKQAYNKVMANTDEYPPSIVKMANFAKNAAGWNKAEYGGEKGQVAYLENRDRAIKEAMGKAEDGMEMYQRGGTSDPRIRRNMNWIASPRYIDPILLRGSNDNFSLAEAAYVAADAYSSLFGGREDESGLKEGFYRDIALKKGKIPRKDREKVPEGTTAGFDEYGQIVYKSPDYDEKQVSSDSQNMMNTGFSVAPTMSQYPALKEFLNMAYGGDIPRAQMGSGMGSMFLEDIETQQELDEFGEPIFGSPFTFDSQEKDPFGQRVGRGIDRFMDSRFVEGFGEIGNIAVNAANVVNDWFRDRRYIRAEKQRDFNLIADQSYATAADPFNNRGYRGPYYDGPESDFVPGLYMTNTSGVTKYGGGIDNPGFKALPPEVQENIKANMKKGGEFKPHMMYDPETGKGYEAKVPGDHERMAKMGYLHKDEMQTGGSVTPEMKAYLKALEWHKEARQAVGTNNTERLKQLRLSKPYSNNDLAGDFSELQKLRQAAGLGLMEEASILFPHVGQQIRGGFNQMLGTNFEQGGEVEVDSDMLAKLIAAGADISFL